MSETRDNQFFLLGASNCRQLALAANRKYVYIPYFSESSIDNFITSFQFDHFPKKCVIFSNTNNLIAFRRRQPEGKGDIHIHFVKHMRKKEKLHNILRQMSRIIDHLIQGGVEIIVVSHMMRCLVQTCTCTTPEKFFYVRPLKQKTLFKSYENSMQSQIEGKIVRFVTHDELVKLLYLPILGIKAPKKLTCNNFLALYSRFLGADHVHVDSDNLHVLHRVVTDFWESPRKHEENKQPSSVH